MWIADPTANTSPASGDDGRACRHDGLRWNDHSSRATALDVEEMASTRDHILTAADETFRRTVSTAPR